MGELEVGGEDSLKCPKRWNVTGGGRQSQRRFADDLQITPLSSQPGDRISAAAIPPTFLFFYYYIRTLDKSHTPLLHLMESFLLLSLETRGDPSRGDSLMTCRGYALSTYRAF
jgi:hypothetical protein